MAKIKVELIENFLVVWNPTEGSQLYKTEFYGKPLGIPKPKIPEFDVPLLLDLMEGLYLAKKGIITIYEGSGKRKVGLKKLKQKARQLYEEFDEKYAVYRDLRDSGLIVTPGIKFGCDFAVYKYGPGVEHAPYMVSLRRQALKFQPRKSSRLGDWRQREETFHNCRARLGHGKTKYLIFKWFKA